MIKDALDEILAQRQVVEPPFLFQRQQRKVKCTPETGHFFGHF
jgi:hypothetical protein